jgi:hypothetical protein
MILQRLASMVRSEVRALRQSESLLLNTGKLLINSHATIQSFQLSDFEFKIFSQWGEDGIIQYLIKNINIENKSFIEFGVEDFFESNCRFLMMNDYWNGFVIDGSKQNIEKIKKSYWFHKYNLEPKESFITRENINYLLKFSDFPYDIGIISIDIDGVDFHVFEAMESWKPAIYIFEYNSNFGSMTPVSVPYDPMFVRKEKHWSNQYWGASLSAFDYLAQSRGYSLVGVNGAGSNAFFVRNDLLNDRVRATTVQECFRSMSFRDSRDQNGNLTFANAEARRAMIAHLPLVNVITSETISVADLPD